MTSSQAPVICKPGSCGFRLALPPESLCGLVVRSFLTLLSSMGLDSEDEHYVEVGDSCSNVADRLRALYEKLLGPSGQGPSLGMLGATRDVLPNVLKVFGLERKSPIRVLVESVANAIRAACSQEGGGVGGAEVDLVALCRAEYYKYARSPSVRGPESRKLLSASALEQALALLGFFALSVPLQGQGKGPGNQWLTLLIADRAGRSSAGVGARAAFEEALGVFRLYGRALRRAQGLGSAVLRLAVAASIAEKGFFNSPLVSSDSLMVYRVTKGNTFSVIHAEPIPIKALVEVIGEAYSVLGGRAALSDALRSLLRVAAGSVKAPPGAGSSVVDAAVSVLTEYPEFLVLYAATRSPWYLYAAARTAHMYRRSLERSLGRAGAVEAVEDVLLALRRLERFAAELARLG